MSLVSCFHTGRYVCTESLTACRTVRRLQHSMCSVPCLKLQESFNQYHQLIKLVLQQLFTVFTLYTRLYLSGCSFCACIL